MPLNLTKVAYGITSVEMLEQRLKARADEGECFLTTRFLPKRVAEITPEHGENGSLFWIIKHQLLVRSAIVKFGEAPDGRVAIHLDPRLVMVQGRGKRAHQGWRYLEDKDTPADLGGDSEGTDVMPAALVGKLSALGLI